MNGKQLKNSILQWAIQGKLVPQDPNDEPASVLLERIRAEKARLVKEKKVKKDKNESIIYRGEDNSYYEKFLATGEVKCIDEEIPFEIPKGWEWCRLGEISTYAETKKKINASKADSMLWGLDLEDIEKGGRLLNMKTVGERQAIGDKTIFNRGDILYSKLRPYLLKVLVAPKGGICTPEIIPFTCYGNIYKDYIVSFLKSPYVDVYINSVTFGVKMPRVSTETMTSLLVPLPPLYEQLRIDIKTKELMPYIDEYEKAQDKLNKLNKELPDIIRKSILQEAIQGKLVPQIAEEGTAQELLEQIKLEKHKLIKDGKLKKSALTDSVIYKGDDNKYYEQVGKKCLDITTQIPFEIPENWVWTRLSYIANIYTGNSISETEKKSKFTDVVGHYYIGTKDVDFNNRVIYDNGIAIPKQYEPDFRLAPNNSILMCIEGGSAGRKIAILNQDVCFGNKLCCFSPFVGIGKYIYYYLQSPSFFELFNLNKTGIIGGVSIAKVKEILIPLPPIKEQQRIVAQIEKLFEQLR